MKNNNEKSILQSKHFQYMRDESEQKQDIRLDVYLTQQLPDYSRTVIKKLVSQGFVLVNENVVSKGSYLLRNGDTIQISFPLEKRDDSRAQKVDLDIVAEHDDFLVINKPPGLIVHFAPSSKDEVTLVDGLLYHFKEFAQFDDTERPGIVHRLDKNTSGLIIVARNPKSQRALAQCFKDREMKKSYLAIVKGHPEKSGTIDFAIGRHPSMRHKMSHNGIASRAAQTDYQVLAYYEDTALVLAKPITGRTHQIRVHLAAIGHAIIGDEVYGLKSKIIKRQALHAWQIAFDYQGIGYEYHAPLPDDMKSALAVLRKGLIEEA